MKVKEVKVTNPKNVLVQIPGWIAQKWQLEEGDTVEMHIAQDEKTVCLNKRLAE